jgi:hypothetical protein
MSAVRWPVNCCQSCGATGRAGDPNGDHLKGCPAAPWYCNGCGDEMNKRDAGDGYYCARCNAEAEDAAGGA